MEITHILALPALLIVGIITLIGFYTGKSMRFIRLPSIIGFMIVGTILGPSVLDLLNDSLRNSLAFITELSLGFVAVSIGLELSLSSLKQQGAKIVLIIFSESFLAFIVVCAGIYLLTGDMALALIFGAIAPASAPAGTVAVIQEYKARGSLTKALYSVVGFDDGLGIIIFGFASTISKSILSAENGDKIASIGQLILSPITEIGLSLLVGILTALLFCLLARRTTSGSRDIFILIFAFVLITTGICLYADLSFILTNMIFGIVVVNTQRQSLIRTIRDELTEFMPLLFILFFVLAGANLHIAALPALGVMGIVYVLCRSFGLMGGAWFGAVVGRAEDKIRKYLGMGILSQAGVAIGLSLIVKQDFSLIGSHGVAIGTTVITTVTATSIIFELIGPVTTKIGLKRAGEIHSSGRNRHGSAVK